MTPQELVYRNRLPAEWRAVYEERAAIMEYEAGMPRDEAEARAVWDTIRQPGCNISAEGKRGRKTH